MLPYNHLLPHIRRFASIAALAILLVAMGASLAFSAVLPAPQEAQALHLRANIIAKDAQIKFGDVFSDAGPLANEVLTRAPAPGRKLSLDPGWLSRQVAAHGFTWTNASNLLRVTVARDGRQISKQKIRTLIADRLEMQGDGARYDVAISAGLADFYAPAEINGEPQIVDLDFSPQTGIFNARILPFAGAAPRSIKGRAFAMAEVPVLRVPRAAGDAINAEDVHWISVRLNRVRPGMLREVADITGRVARRTLRANQPLRASDVKRQALIKKGEIITVLYQIPGLKLSARGRALSEGAMGDSLRVVNLQSKRTIDVLVSGPGRAVAANSPTLGG